MRKRAYFTRGRGAVDFCACLKIVELILFRQALVVCELEGLAFFF
jgi:hypothetical protein